MLYEDADNKQQNNKSTSDASDKNSNNSKSKQNNPDSKQSKTSGQNKKDSSGGKTEATNRPHGGAMKGVSRGLRIASAALNKIKAEAEDISNKDSPGDGYSVNIGGSIIGTVVLIVVFGTMLLKVTPGSNENYKETSYSQELPEVHRATIEKEFSQTELEEYDAEAPLQAGAEAYIYGIDDTGTTGFQNAMEDAITEKCHDIIKNLDINWLSFSDILSWLRGYDAEASLQSFYNCPWPYDLRESEDFPLIGNVMGIEGYEPYEPKFNDVNYAEVLAVLSQNPEYNWENCKYEQFNEYIRTDKVKNLYYELEVNWVVVYTGEKQVKDEKGNTKTITISDYLYYETEEEVSSSPDSVEKDNVVCKRDSYYCDVKIMPFGLRELYMIADVKPDDDHVDFYRHTNYEMLDRQEMYERIYLRDAEEIVGPAYDELRSDKSIIYDYLIYNYGVATGRSAFYYIAEPFNLKNIDYLSYMSETEIDLDDLRDMLLKYPEGAAVLDMLKYYINQGWNVFKGDMRGPSDDYPITNYACCDFAYMMAYQYLSGHKLSTDDVINICRDYVGMNGQFQTTRFCSERGMTSSGNKKFSPTSIAAEINAGNPVILHIRGVWVYNGRTYHGNSGGHFLTICGYDENGFYVCDPGSTNNTNNGPIPYEAFNGYGVTDLYYRTITYGG